MDRPSFVGGFLIEVKTTFSSDLFPIANDAGIVFVTVKVCIDTALIYLTCSYIPPTSDSIVYLNHLCAIQFVMSSFGYADQIIAMGDFNLPHFSWIPCDDFNLLLPSICHNC